MAKFFLVNPVQLGSSSIKWPGTVIDSDHDDVASIEAGGGLLVTTSDPTVAVAAEKARSVRIKGGSIFVATAIMLAAAATAGVLAPGSVSAAELASSAVEEAKIAAGAVTSDKIGTGAVTSDKIGTGAVTSDKIGTGAVTSDKLAYGAGVAALIAAGLGGSATSVHGDAAPASVLAPDATNDRAILVVAVVTVDLTGTAAFSVDSVGGVPLLAIPALTAAGVVLVGAGVVPADATDSEVECTPTAGTTGAVAVTALALPT